MSTTKRKYIDSHWLVFGIKGLLATVAGLGLILNPSINKGMETLVIGCVMGALGIIELFNVLFRKRKQHAILVPAMVAIIEILVSIVMLFAIAGKTADETDVFRVIVLSCYTLYAAVGSLVVSFNADNITDRVIWIIEGAMGAVMAFVMFASPDFMAHFQCFGIYWFVKGLTDIIFGAHTLDRMGEDRAEKEAKKAERSLAKKKGKK